MRDGISPPAALTATRDARITFLPYPSYARRMATAQSRPCFADWKATLKGRDRGIGVGMLDRIEHDRIFFDRPQ
jgi:hypothetical protein